MIRMLFSIVKKIDKIYPGTKALDRFLRSSERKGKRSDR